MNKDKISVNQVLKMFIVAISASIVRLVPSALSNVSKQASWVSPIVAILITIFDMYIVSKVFKRLKSKKEVRNLSDVFDTVYGKVIGKVLVIMYIIWTFILMAVHIRFFGERIVATLFTYAPIQIFIVALLAIVYISSRKKVSNLAKFCEIAFIIFMIIAIFIALIGTSYVKLENMLPVTIYDAMPILKGSLLISSIFSTGFLFLFFGEEINEKDKLFKKGKWLPILYSVLCLLTVVITVGKFGDKLTSAFIQPFFMAIKKISIFSTIENIEPIFISFWLISDFTIITYYTIVISYALKNLIGSDKKNLYITPILFIVYILANGLSTNYFELAKLSAGAVVIISFVLCFLSPIITYIIAGIKGQLSKVE